MTTPSDGTAAGQAPGDAQEARAHFRRTVVRVMVMQVAALIALWWLQTRYGS